MQKDKTIFKLDALPLEKFATALGLPGAPKVKFVTREMAKQRKNAMRVVPQAEPEQEEEEGELDGSDDESEDEGDSSESDQSENDKPQITEVPVAAKTKVGNSPVFHPLVSELSA